MLLLLVTSSVISSISDWSVTEATQDYSQNNINHRYLGAKSFPFDDAIYYLFRQLIPTQTCTLNAAKYVQSHYIDPHDGTTLIINYSSIIDRAYKEINSETYSRDIAVIYYLAKDWKAEDGGALIDVPTQKQYVPLFNSLVAFQVPRFHAVEPVKSPNKERISLFGWFMLPGQSYDLQTTDPAAAAAENSIMME